jgi:hypothetical protein
MLGGAVAWYVNHPATAASAPPLTPDAKSYVRSLQLSDVTMKATESYVNQVVLRKRVPIVKNLVKPGESRSFRLPFDEIPESWNNQMPQLVIAGIEFG